MGNGTGVSEPANQSPPIFRVGKRHRTAGNSKTAKIEANILHFPASQALFCADVATFCCKDTGGVVQHWPNEKPVRGARRELVQNTAKFMATRGFH